MDHEQSGVTRRRYLATGAVVSLGGVAGCTDSLDSSEEEASTGPESESQTATASDSGGPLRVRSIERTDDGGQTVRTAATVENVGDEARQADLVVTLSHTEADGSIDRTRPVLLAAGFEQEVVVPFRPRFFSEDGVDRPESGEFQFDGRFESVDVLEDYPGLVAPSDQEALADGAAWPGAAYDTGATAYNPGTEAPRTEPTADWTASAVEYAYGTSGPIVADETVIAGRTVRALSVDDGSEKWVHDGPARTSRLAVGDGIVAFGTPDDIRALEADSGAVRWTVPADDIWHGAPTVADGRVYASNGELHAIEAATGEVAWTADVGGSLAGPPPVADGVVLAGGDPLRAIDAETGTVRWAVSGGEPVTAAAVAHETVFALTDSQLVALDLAEGRTRWFAPGPFQAERIAVGDDSVYAQRARDYRMVALDAANGNLEWESPKTDGVLGPPSASDGVLVVTSEQGTMYGFDTQTGELRWSLAVPSGVPGALAVADGTAYFNEPNGPLRALRSEE